MSLRRVTRAQGLRFAQEFVKAPNVDGTASLAFEAAGVLEWPDRDSAAITPAQDRATALEDAIIARTFELAREAIADAFVQAANELLSVQRR